MLHWTPLLNRHELVGFLRDRNFLDSRGANPDRYWVGPIDRMVPEAAAECPVVIGYSAPDDPKRAKRARMLLFMGGTSIEIDTSLPRAMSLLTYLFDQPTNLARMLSADPGLLADAALSAFGLDRGVLKRDVGQYPPGEYLAPMRTDWCYYLVEPYGEVVTIAECDQPAPLAYLIAAENEDTHANVSERVASFIPPDSAAIIAGAEPLDPR